MTSASELPLSHARSTILRLAVPPFHSFLPLSFLRIISSPLSLHPLDNLSLPPPPILSFFFFARLFSFSRFAPSDSRRAVHLGERERERGRVHHHHHHQHYHHHRRRLQPGRGTVRRRWGEEIEGHGGGEKGREAGTTRVPERDYFFFFEGERGAVNGGASGRGVEKKGGKGGRGTAQSCDSAAEGLADVWKGSRVLMVGRDLSEEPTFHR